MISPQHTKIEEDKAGEDRVTTIGGITPAVKIKLDN